MQKKMKREKEVRGKLGSGCSMTREEEKSKSRGRVKSREYFKGLLPRVVKKNVQRPTLLVMRGKIEGEGQGNILVVLLPMKL